MSSASSHSDARRAPGGGEIVTIQCGAAANWIGTQYHLLQNSNCDVNSAFARSTHFRRSEATKAAASSSASGDAAVWHPRVVCMDASVGLDGIVATFAQQRDGEEHEELVAEYSQKARSERSEEQKEAATASAARSSRPQTWSDLAKNVMPFHHKSLYSMPGLYEGTTDFHLHEQGKEIMEREAVHEEVIDRVRWFLEECDHPDGLHVLVDANSGWSGVGSTLLGLLRDEYERIPIFCISTLQPPAPRSALGESFSSRTSVLQSVLNSSLLLQSASQLATAYLPLTTHYLGQGVPAAAAIQRGELYETSTLLAWMMHLATAEYRLQPRSTNMATTLAALTQQTQANIVAAKIMTEKHLHAQNKQTTVDFRSSDSSSHVAFTPVLHTHAAALPLSLLGHDHSYHTPVDPDDAGRSDAFCGLNTALSELVHAFGNTEEMSHAQLLKAMEQQPPAMFRRVYGTTRINIPPSFPSSFHSLLTDGQVVSLYRCRTVGAELSHLGHWLSHLNRGGIVSSQYTASSPNEARDANQLPALLRFLQSQRQRNASKSVDEDGDRARGTESEQLHMTQWSQDELDEFSECGTTLENFAESY